jgi:hypothetical protein
MHGVDRRNAWGSTGFMGAIRMVFQKKESTGSRVSGVKSIASVKAEIAEATGVGYAR